MTTRSVVIIGLGLIGGAVGMALRRNGWTVRYLDPYVPLEDAQRAGAADERVESIGDEDVVVLAAPVDVAVALVPTIESAGIVTSVCSVMRPLRAVARENFVAGHPLAGWHEGGLANAHEVKLEGSSWFLDGHDPRVERLVRDCGANPVPCDAAQHDAMLALTSHLPQVLSTALFAYLHDRANVVPFAGGGLRSFRLAASDGAMWHSVLEANRDNLRPHADAVAALVRAIIEGDERDAFAKASALWRALQS